MSDPMDGPKSELLRLGTLLPVVVECVFDSMPRTSQSAFQTTSWSLVLAASAHPTTNSREAMAALCQTYWGPIYAFIRRNGHDPDRSQDLTQGFFALLIEKNYVGDADRHRGRFRSFLLTAVKHFLANEWDYTHALKRGGGQVTVSIDLVEAERWYAPAAVAESTPETLFDRRWALSLLEHVMAKLRADFAALGKAEQFDSLLMFLNQDSDRTRYDELASTMGVSAGSLRTSAHRMRRKYRDLLRAEIAETVSKPEEVDEEIRFLLATLNT